MAQPIPLEIPPGNPRAELQSRPPLPRRKLRHPACGHLELFPRSRRICRCRTRGINHSS